MVDNATLAMAGNVLLAEEDNKVLVLHPDGHVVDEDGRVLLPPDETRAGIYQYRKISRSGSGLTEIQQQILDNIIIFSHYPETTDVPIDLPVGHIFYVDSQKHWYRVTENGESSIDEEMDDCRLFFVDNEEGGCFYGWDTYDLRPIATRRFLPDPLSAINTQQCFLALRAGIQSTAPSATAYPQNTFYFNSTDRKLYATDGSTWLEISSLLNTRLYVDTFRDGGMYKFNGTTLVPIGE